MAGVKRPRADSGVLSPYMPMFRHFRDELDEHHDRRERVVKAARDITALSKKIVRNLNQPIPAPITGENAERSANITRLFTSIAADLHGINAWRYQRQVSGGVQELIEAVSFEHYLSSQTLISPEEAAKLMPAGLGLTEDDYVLGLFDLVGELMRFAITFMATAGALPGERGDHAKDVGGDAGNEDVMDTAISAGSGDILTDLRSLRIFLESLDFSGSGPNFGLARDVDKKMGVMIASVEKVEQAAYGMIIRGRERPRGWVPDIRDDGGGGGGPEPVESF
ncbi:MAG: hypothetical protein M1832_000762 [Thelocarpon impressellum]|nr:MAG: hypothetical protein M1832_000762 [Thelocarpon impressellum]